MALSIPLLSSGDYVIEERIGSRRFNGQYGKKSEERVYHAKVKEGVDKIITPAHVYTIGPYPNPGGQPAAFSLSDNMPHPEWYGRTFDTGQLVDTNHLGRGEAPETMSLMRLSDVRATWLNKHVLKAIEIKLLFENIPDPSKPIVEVTGSLTTEQTDIDIKGNPITNSKGKQAKASRYKPQRVERVTFRRIQLSESAHRTITASIGTVNKRLFSPKLFRGGDPAGQWMLMNAEITPIDDYFSTVQYNFQHDRFGWTTKVPKIDQAGKVVLASNGKPAFKELELYDQIDFRHRLSGYAGKGTIR